MEPNMYGVPMPYGGGRRKRKKKNGFVRFLLGLLGVAVAVIIVLSVASFLLGFPLLLGFDPWDAADFVDAPGLAKIDAFKKGWQHKRGISEITFSHDGRSITLFDDNGTISRVESDGYGDGDDGEFESDLEEARRLLDEWGLSQ